MGKAYDLSEAVLSKELLNKIDGKLDKSEAISDFRSKAADITEDDLSPALRQQIQSGGGSGGPVDENGNSVAYDDTALRARIVTLETDKMDKSGMTSYYKKDEIIHEANISPDYKNSVTQKIHAVDVKVIDMETGKADKAELLAFRKKSEKISEIDLSQTLYDRILAGGGGGSGGVSLETVQTMIGNLDSKKADKAQLDLVRKIADPIKMTDVDATLNDALEKAVIAAAGLSNKADKADLALYRKSAVPIVLTDMDTELASKISDVVNAVDDMETFVQQQAEDIRNSVFTDLSNTIGHQTDLVYPFQVEITTDYPGHDGHYTIFWALNVLYEKYRRKDVAIAETDLSTALSTKINTTKNNVDSLIGSTGRVTTAEGKIETLETKVSTLENEVSELKSTVSELRSIISALHPDIAEV